MAFALDVLTAWGQFAICMGVLFVVVVVNETVGVLFAVGLAFVVWLLRGGGRG